MRHSLIALSATAIVLSFSQPVTASAETPLEAIQAWVAQPAATRPAEPPAGDLSKAEAGEAATALLKFVQQETGTAAAEEIAKKEITIEDKTLRWLEMEFGSAPAGARSLWISLHGGGGAPKAVNDQQWQNQIRLYEPEEGWYVAPRAPGDTWDLWHTAPVDGLLARLIADFVSQRGVNPDKVYLMGYSAGGDGVYQLAPRLADRFAAAAMMAGHPNDATALGLRNLPFALFCGGADAAYKRNEVTAQRAAQLDALQKADPDGYTHMSRIYEGLPHWMNRKDAEAVPWMAGFTRRTWPKRVVWQQDDVTHRRFYWLAVSNPERGQTITGEVSGNTISLTCTDRTSATLLLSDSLVDLDQPVTVTVNGTEIHRGPVPRRASVILRELRERPDLPGAPAAELPLTWLAAPAAAK